MGEAERKPVPELSAGADSGGAAAVTPVLPPAAEAASAAAPEVAVSAEQKAGSLPTAHPSWFTPLRLLVMFCIINLLNYIDRGAIASNGVNGTRKSCTDNGTCTPGSGIQGQFNLSNFKDGFLSSAFMVGLLVSSPIFASLAKIHNPFRLIGIGLLVWTIATAGCGFSIDFWSIMICRMFVGVGEASFISLAAPFIDDNAPPAQKTAWLAAFYMCIPAGVALGYVYGGQVGSHLNWHAAFWGESILMLPFVIMFFVMRPLQLKGFSGAIKQCAATKQYATTESEGHDGTVNADTCAEIRLDSEEIKQHGSDSNQISAERQKLKSSFSMKSIWTRLNLFWNDIKALHSEKVYVINVLGYIAYNFVIGAYSYWGPKAGYAIYHMGNADLIFGGLTIVCGILGTLGGGVFLDWINSTIPNSFKLLSGATFLGAAFCFGAFCFKNLYAFIALFAIGELLVFATQAPVNYVCLHCVKPSLRPLSMAMSTVSIHIFGDVPSSPLVGVLQDHINNWRASALLLTSILFLASIQWFIGVFFRGVDRFEEESEDTSLGASKSDHLPHGNALV